MISQFTAGLFFSLIAFLVAFLFICTNRLNFRLKLSRPLILLWLLITGLLSVKGFFMDFNTIPPRILFAILPMAIFLVYIAISPKIISLIQDIPHSWLIYIQVFRIVMEIILWLLAKQHVIPEIMTWHGHNFDILAGITAPFVAYFCFTTKKWNKNIALVWNILGILLLVNVFGHGFLSAPTPFQVFVTNPPNTFVGTFPYIWLPAFVVPCAVLFHILSIRKILNEK